MPVPNRDVYLRVTRAGSRFTFEASLDGKDWKEIRTEEAKLPGRLRVGVLAINTPTRDFTANLDGLKLTPR